MDTDPECFEYYQIDTEEDGKRYIRFGRYIYNAEGSIDDDHPELTWREVEEEFSFPLDRFIQMRKEKQSPWGTKECYDRPNDYIDDISEEEAMDRFSWYLEHVPRLDGDQVTMDTPDGWYFGVICGGM